jgi:hypothetical protein
VRASARPPSKTIPPIVPAATLARGAGDGGGATAPGSPARRSALLAPELAEQPPRAIEVVVEDPARDIERFVGEELLVDGAVDVFPIMGFAVVAASALTGLAVLRMYFSLFCGRPEARVHAGLQLGLTRREAWTFVALVVALVGFGIAPRPLVDSRFAASAEILRQRQARTAGMPGTHEPGGQHP